MFHDQGHIALKLLGMHRAVNVTLGLPIIRTSVAHGTAFDIAWRGRAETGSLIEASARGQPAGGPRGRGSPEAPAPLPTLRASHAMPPCPAPDTCRLYLLRHGATDFNCAEPPRLQGRRVDLPLSAEGLDRGAGRRPPPGRRAPGRRLHQSPAPARQTADAIAAPHGLAIQSVEELIEVDVGQWEGRSWEEVARTDAEAYRLFTADASIHPYLGGENLSTVLARVLPAMERLLAENLGRLIVVVAHNVVNRVYLAHVLGIPLARYRSVVQDNCAISLLEYRAGQTKALWINSVSHLEKAEGGGEPEALASG